MNRRKFIAGSGTVAAGLWGPPLMAAATAPKAASADTDARQTDVPHFASGLRVGEVSQTSAIVWTRLSLEPERRWDGVLPSPLMSPTRVLSPSPDIPADQWEGAVPGTAGDVRVLVGTSPDLRETVVTTEWRRVDREHDFIWQFPIDGLKPGTRYYYAAEGRFQENSRIGRSAVGTFRTAPSPDEWEEVWFAVITCQLYFQRDEPDGFRIYRSMGNLSPVFLNFPDFIVRTGDNVYYDRDNPRGSTVDLCRLHWQRMYSLPLIRDFLRQVPSYWEKDDHDAFFDDSYPGMKAPWIEPLTFDDGARLFREQTPVGDKLYRTFRWGRGLQIWLTENRDFRSPDTMPDGPEKTIWGAEQKRWLKESILASDATFKVLVSPTAIVGPDNPDQTDSHADPSYAHEGNEFRRWVYENGLTNLYVIAGDRHWQYASMDPKSGLREFACGASSDRMTLRGPGFDHNFHSFYREGGGFVSISFRKGSRKVLANPQRVVVEDGAPILTVRIHDVDGNVVFEFRDNAAK